VQEGITVARETPGVAFVALSGEHDQYSSPRLAQVLADELAGAQSVIVDLSSTEFLDSTTAGALLVGNERAVKAERHLVVLLPESAGWAVHRLFETARLKSILTVVDSREAALAAVEPATA
jgi:anti-anti-sigma factor